MKKWIVLFSLVLVVAVFAGCSKADQGTSGTSTKEIVITAKNMMFEPATVTVDKGTKVKVTFKNEEDKANTLIVEGTNIKIENVAPKASMSTEFVADRQGEFAYKTTASEMGSMTGKLIVK